MALTQEQMEQIKELSKHLVKFLNNYHPHVAVVVEPSRIEILEGAGKSTVYEFVKD